LQEVEQEIAQRADLARALLGGFCYGCVGHRSLPHSGLVASPGGRANGRRGAPPYVRITLCRVQGKIARESKNPHMHNIF
jgi:hypothetical protein